MSRKVILSKGYLEIRVCKEELEFVYWVALMQR